MDEQKRKEVAASLLKDMEATAARMRELIVAMPPHDLLGYIYAQHMMKAMADQSAAEEQREADGPDDLINENQFLLEYVHAVLASDGIPADVTFDEGRCAELFELGRKLRQQAMFFAMATSADTKEGIFGPDTADIEFRAKSTWVMLRGNRYQVLEGEFYSYVLAPHNEVLKEVYGVGAADIAEGFQAMADATHSGHADAIMEMIKQFEAAQAFAAAQGKPLEDVMEAWVAAHAKQSKAAGRAMDDMFRGGIANVSRHTRLPPALDFSRHAQSVQNLVLKAYKQCERFFNYLSSADEVPLYHLADDKYEECGRARRSDYRVMVPIGLTVESFSPFSTYCKELPQVAPLLGRHAFVSLSIDDLFVLKRFLPTPGEFVHYMEVRQAVAGMRQAHLFDEFDHLGAYLKKNRFDQDIAEQLKGGKVNMVIWNGMSDIVDRSFEVEDWESRAFPTQDFPEEVLKLLRALDATRARGWLSAESHIRDLGEEGRSDLAKMLSDLRQTLNQHPARYFILTGDGAPLFVWLQQHDHQIDWTRVNDKASAAALAVKASNLIGVVAEVSVDGTYHRAQSFAVHVPTERTEENDHIYEDTARMAQPACAVNLNQPKHVIPPVKAKRLGRNDP